MFRSMIYAFTFLFAGTLAVAAHAGGSESCQLLAAQQSDNHAQETAADGKLIVHEWGTFTTFSGSDGVFLDFRPLANEVSDLPGFVHDRANRSPLAIMSKKKIRGRVRMETPVTYFYTDEIREVNVRVDFPKGLLTEFYPPVKTMLPEFDAKAAYGEGEPIGNSSLDWGTVTLIPPHLLVPELEDETLRSKLIAHLAASAVPADSAGGHYAQSRATDAALVAVSEPPSKFNPTHNTIHMEKFLFYRGVGKFDLPLQAVFDDDGVLTLTNVTNDIVSAAIRVDVKDKQVVVSEFGAVEVGETVRAESSQSMNLGELSRRVVEILVAEGLYEKEAKAMVDTWRRSWFGEEGSRILYIVPPRMTDEILPLTVQPAPDETLRVLVGRMELMSPGLEQQLMDAVRISSQSRANHQQIVKETKEPFPISDQIRQLGRMTEPALVRVSKIASEFEVRREAELLIAQLRSE